MSIVRADLHRMSGFFLAPDLSRDVQVGLTVNVEEGEVIRVEDFYLVLVDISHADMGKETGDPQISCPQLLLYEGQTPPRVDGVQRLRQFPHARYDDIIPRCQSLHVAQ